MSRLDYEENPSHETWQWCLDNAESAVQYLETNHKELSERLSHTEHWDFLNQQSLMRIAEWKAKADHYRELMK